MRKIFKYSSIEASKTCYNFIKNSLFLSLNKKFKTIKIYYIAKIKQFSKYDKVYRKETMGIFVHRIATCSFCI